MVTTKNTTKNMFLDITNLEVVCLLKTPKPICIYIYISYLNIYYIYIYQIIECLLFNVICTQVSIANIQHHTTLNTTATKMTIKAPQLHITLDLSGESCQSAKDIRSRSLHAMSCGTSWLWPKGQMVSKNQDDQWLFLVPLKGGRWHIIPQLAVYTTYINHLYIAFWGVICYLPPFRGTRNNH